MIQLLALLLFVSPGFAKSANYPTYVLAPVDQANQEQSFADFRSKLLSVISQKDVAALEGALGKNIAFSFGGHGDGDGPAGFKRFWKLDKRPEKSKVWDELAGVLGGGGVFSKDHNSFEAPYVWATWPKKYDVYEFNALNAKEVPLHAEAKESSKVVHRVSYELLRVVSRGKKPDSWTTVLMPSGEKLFVQNRFLQSAVGYRARFEWNGKEWKLVTFILSN